MMRIKQNNRENMTRVQRNTRCRGKCKTYGSILVSLTVSATSVWMSVQRTRMPHHSLVIEDSYLPIMMQLNERDLYLSRELLPVDEKGAEDYHEYENGRDSLMKDGGDGNDWRDQHSPSCLQVHEISLQEHSRSVGAGCSMRAWEVQQYDGSKIALKTWKNVSSKGEKYNAAMFETSRKEATISSELAFSPYIVNIYGYCGSSTVAEFARPRRVKRMRPGTFQTPILGTMKLLRTARDIAMGLYHLHYLHSEGDEPTVSHGDLKPAQYLKFSQGEYKLNDFNWATIARRNVGDEERNKFVREIKRDLYHLGGTLYSLLIGNQSNDVVTGKVGKNNDEMSLLFDSEPFANSTNPIDIAVVDAMRASFKFYYNDSGVMDGAREVAHMLEAAYQTAVSNSL